MSIDNTVVVLITRRRDGVQGVEFRVANIMGAEFLQHDADYPSHAPELTRAEVLRAFAKARVRTSLVEMLDDVEVAVQETGGIVEYGVQSFDLSHLYFPSRRLKRQALRSGLFGTPSYARC